MDARRETGSPGSLVLRLSGDLTLPAASDLRDHLMDAFQQGATQVILQMSDVTAIDVCGLQLLVAAGKVACREGTRLSCEPPLPPCLDEAWRKAGLGDGIMLLEAGVG